MTPPKKSSSICGRYNLRPRLARLRSGTSGHQNVTNNSNQSSRVPFRRRGTRERAMRSSSTTASMHSQTTATTTSLHSQTTSSSSHSTDASSSNNESIKCAICLDTERFRAMQYIPCGHGFHAKCCERWLARSGVCPVCRTPAITPAAPPVNNRFNHYNRGVRTRRRRRRHVFIQQQLHDMVFSAASIIIIDFYRLRQTLAL